VELVIKRRKLRPNRSKIGDAIRRQTAAILTKTCGSFWRGAVIWRHLSPRRVEKLCRCISWFSALNYSGGMLSKSLCYLYEVGLKTFALIFVVFAIFHRSFVKMVMLHGDETGRSSILPKLCPVVEDVEPILKDANHFFFYSTHSFPTWCKMLIFHLRVNEVPAVAALRHPAGKNYFSRLAAGACSSISLKLCTVIDIETVLKGGSRFWIQCIFLRCTNNSW